MILCKTYTHFIAKNKLMYCTWERTDKLPLTHIQITEIKDMTCGDNPVVLICFYFTFLPHQGPSCTHIQLNACMCTERCSHRTCHFTQPIFSSSPTTTLVYLSSSKYAALSVNWYVGWIILCVYIYMVQIRETKEKHRYINWYFINIFSSSSSKTLPNSTKSSQCKSSGVIYNVSVFGTHSGKRFLFCLLSNLHIT